MKRVLTLFIILSNLSVFGQTASKYIVVDQFGYRPTAEKVAVIRNPAIGYDAGESFSPGNSYALVNEQTNAQVFTGTPTVWKNGQIDSTAGDRAWWFDFSTYTTPGTYYVLDVDRNVKSYTFEIREDIYNVVLKHAVRTFFYQRSGFAKEQPYAEEGWVDGASHVGPLQDKNCRYYLSPNDASTEKDLHGGWYDAGDQNKYTAWTAGYIIEMLKMYEEAPSVWTDDFNIPESNNGIPDIIDEAKWGMDHLLRLQNNDGSLIALVGVNSASPPSSATGQSLYSNVNTSSTRKAAAAYAFGARIFKKAGLLCYADTLEQAALKAWEWAEANPAVMWSNVGTGVGAGDPEVNEYSLMVFRLEAAMQLFALTGDTKYRDIYEADYQKVHLAEWWYAFPYEHYEQEVLLYYSKVPNASESVVSDIKNRYNTAIGRENNLGVVESEKSAYKAYLESYVWGSNNITSMQGLMFYEVALYDIDAGKEAQSLTAAENYLHYIHGVNPLQYCYLTNMNGYGADNSVTQIFHSWFSDESYLWDQVGVSPYGPAPGFLSGGPNSEYNIDACCPYNCGSSNNNALCNNPQVAAAIDQPPMKSYADINDGWPTNTWSITENSCGYQVSYIRLLSKFVQAKGSGEFTNEAEDCDLVTLIHENESVEMEVFPNPFGEDGFNISVSGDCHYIIHDVNGRIIEEGSGSDSIIAGKSLKSGIYFISITTSGEEQVFQIIKH